MKASELYVNLQELIDMINDIPVYKTSDSIMDLQKDIGENEMIDKKDIQNMINKIIKYGGVHL